MSSEFFEEEKNKSSKVGDYKDVKIDYSMPDLSNDPFLIRKAEAAAKMLDRYGVPEALLQRK